MAKSKETPVSPIADPAPNKSPRDALAGFLRYTVDTPDFERAKAFLSKRSATAGNIHTSALPAGATYTLGAEEADELGKRFTVRVKGGVASAEQSGEEMAVPVVVVEEEGEWKIDLPATMERMVGGVMSVVKDAVGAMGEAMAGALSEVQSAMHEGLGTPAGASEPARMTEAASAPRKAPPAKKSPVKAPAKKAKAKPKPKPKVKVKVKAKPRPAMKKKSTKPAKSKPARAKAKAAKRTVKPRARAASGRKSAKKRSR